MGTINSRRLKRQMSRQSLAEINVKQMSEKWALREQSALYPLRVYTGECISPLSLLVHLDTLLHCRVSNHKDTLIPGIKMCPESVIMSKRRGADAIHLQPAGFLWGVPCYRLTSLCFMEYWNASWVIGTLCYSPGVVSSPHTSTYTLRPTYTHTHLISLLVFLPCISRFHLLFFLL